MTPTLENVRALATSLSERSPEIEAGRCIPADLVNALRGAGVFRMYVPRTHQGDEMSPVDGTRVVEELARADGSVGWVAAIAAVSPAFLCRLPTSTFDRIYSTGPDVVVAGALVPKGKAVPEDGGFRFAGQWSFASGCTHADYIVVNGIVVDDAGDPTTERRMAVAPAASVAIVDTWRVHGLRGTGSHDVKLDDVFVRTEWTGVVLAPPAVIRQPIDHVPILARLGYDLCAVAVGIARGAFDDLVQIGEQRRSMGLLPRAAGDPVFQHTVGRIDAEVRALVAVYRNLIREFTDRIVDGHADAIETARAPSRASMAYVAGTAAQLVERCYSACGTSGMQEDSPLQRRFRDIRTLTQHVVFSPNAFTIAGAQALGEPAPPGLF